jgi:hypothetical protein
LVPVLKISLGSDPVLINLDAFASSKHSILVSILIPQLSDPVPIQVFSYQSEPKLAIRTCLALVLTVASFFLRMGVILRGGGYIYTCSLRVRGIPTRRVLHTYSLRVRVIPIEECSCCFKVRWIPKGGGFLVF